MNPLLKNIRGNGIWRQWFSPNAAWCGFSRVPLSPGSVTDAARPGRRSKTGDSKIEGGFYEREDADLRQADLTLHSKGQGGLFESRFYRCQGGSRQTRRNARVLQRPAKGAGDCGGRKGDHRIRGKLRGLIFRPGRPEWSTEHPRSPHSTLCATWKTGRKTGGTG